MKTKRIKCAFCKGSGIHPGSLSSVCIACHGKKFVEFANPVVQCPSCKGSGRAFRSSSLFCTRCHGVGVIEEDAKAEGISTHTNATRKITALGKYLKGLRKEQELSIRTVAHQCSIAPSYLAKIETGNTFKTIGIETLVKLSKFYGIPVSSMLKEAGFIDSYESDLPELAQYLRLKYQLSPQAIRDMTMAKEIVDKKYEREDARRSR